jgi:hypothetical protein
MVCSLVGYDFDQLVGLEVLDTHGVHVDRPAIAGFLEYDTGKDELVGQV